jgi:flagellar motility protein MotE (MotC chaperone)
MMTSCLGADEMTKKLTITILHQMKQMKLAQILRERTAKPAAELVTLCVLKVSQ